MKLLYCVECQDVIRLVKEERKCSCGKVSGKYLDKLHAEYSGEEAVPIGFDNSSLIKAIQSQPDTGRGRRFDAFVIAKDCDTFKDKTE